MADGGRGSTSRDDSVGAPANAHHQLEEERDRLRGDCVHLRSEIRVLEDELAKQRALHQLQTQVVRAQDAAIARQRLQLAQRTAPCVLRRLAERIEAMTSLAAIKDMFRNASDGAQLLRLE
eukprot:5887766-Prymnesium_polylepis.1